MNLFWHGPFYTLSSRTGHKQHLLCQMYIKSTILTHSVLFMTSPRWHCQMGHVKKNPPFPINYLWKRTWCILAAMSTDYICADTQSTWIYCMHFGKKNHLVQFPPCMLVKDNHQKKQINWKDLKDSGGVWQMIVVESDKGSGEPLLLHISHRWDMETSALQLL